MRRLKHEEVKKLIQDSIATKRTSQDMSLALAYVLSYYNTTVSKCIQERPRMKVVRKFVLASSDRRAFSCTVHKISYICVLKTWLECSSK